MSLGEWVGLLILVVGFYLFLREFFVRDADPLYDASTHSRFEKHCPDFGSGHLREWRGPLYWLTWVIKQW